MLRILIVGLLAVFGPYLIAVFIEMEVSPANWHWLTRIALAVPFSFYLYLVLSAVAESKPVRKQ